MTDSYKSESSQDSFFCSRHLAKIAACNEPIDHRFKGCIDIEHYGNEESDGFWTNWALTTGYTLLIFHHRMQHDLVFARYGYRTEDMLMTGSGVRCRSGVTHQDLIDDPKAEWELWIEIKRLLHEQPDLLKKPTKIEKEANG